MSTIYHAVSRAFDGADDLGGGLPIPSPLDHLKGEAELNWGPCLHADPAGSQKRVDPSDRGNEPIQPRPRQARRQNAMPRPNTSQSVGSRPSSRLPCKIGSMTSHSRSRRMNVLSEALLTRREQRPCDLRHMRSNFARAGSVVLCAPQVRSTTGY